MGDQNTAFFGKVAISRCSHNLVMQALDDNGEQVSNKPSANDGKSSVAFHITISILGTFTPIHGSRVQMQSFTETEHAVADEPT